MSIAKEYLNGKTKIRIYDDFIEIDNKTKELIISLVVEYLKNIDNI